MFGLLLKYDPMKTTFLDFEQPVAELESKIEQLRFVQDDSAVDISEEGGRFAKALHYDSRKPFELNFRQLRIESCDVLVLIGVWIDQLVYWVLASREISNNKYFFHDKGKVKESLLVISDKNISDFAAFRVAEPLVMDVILKKKT